MLKSLDKIALGTAQFGMNYGISNKDGKVNENEIKLILDLAYKNGINTLDTAKAYGESEMVLGKYFNKAPKSKWNIITKFHTDKKIENQYHNSFEIMNIKPQIILAHSLNIFLSKDFQNAAKLLSMKFSFLKVGVSIYNEEEIDIALNSDFRPQIIQLPINILDTKLFHNDTLTRIFDLGIKIHARSVFLQGLFYLNNFKIKKYFNDVAPTINKLKSIAYAANLNLAELSLLWLLSLNQISLVIIGLDSSDQLRQHIKTINKDVSANIFEEALSINYENDKILNPSLWDNINFN